MFSNNALRDSIRQWIENGEVDQLRAGLIQARMENGVDSETLVAWMDPSPRDTDASDALVWAYSMSFSSVLDASSFLPNEEFSISISLLFARIGITGAENNPYIVSVLTRLAGRVARYQPVSVPEEWRAALTKAGLDGHRVCRQTVPFYTFLERMHLRSKSETESADARSKVRSMFLLLQSHGYRFDKVDGMGNNAWSYAERYRWTEPLAELGAMVPLVPYLGPSKKHILLD